MPDKETYQRYKARGICVRCYQEDAVPGLTRCWRCRANERDYCKIHYYQRKAEGIRKHNPKNKEAMERRNAERHAQGLCIQCGKRPAISDAKNARCKVCQKVITDRVREKSHRNGALPWELRGNGVYCYRCCKPQCHGEKLCPACHAAQSAVMKKLHDEGKAGEGFRKYPLFLKK